MVKLRKKKLKDGKISLYLDIYNNGKRYYEFLKLHLSNSSPQNKETLKLAETIRAKRQIDLQSENYGFLSESRKKINLIQYLYQSAKDKNRSSKVMIKCLINYVERFAKNTNIRDVNEQWIVELEKFISIHVSNNSVANYMDALNTALNKAVKEKLILANPFLYCNVRIRKSEVKKEYLTIEELNKLAATPCSDNEIKRAFLFGCFTGLRISDIIKLSWKDFKGDSIEFQMKKTKKIQVVPLSVTAKKLISNSDTNIIALNKENKVFNLPGMNTILKIINEWVGSAGIEKHITTHSARHTFATLSLTNGVDLYTVSKLLGHSDVKTTQIYGKIVDSKKIEAVNKLPEINIA